MATGPLVVIVGETASGKTSLAIEVALKFGGEIISADSWAVRKELNIGTAKPSPQERLKAKHHLIDVVEPCQEFTAAIFKSMAQQAMADITDRGKLPILTGGSGLYIDGLVYDFSFLPGGDRQKRQQLNVLSNERLLEMIRKTGYSLEGIDIRNKRRLIRVLETAGGRSTRKKLRPKTLLIGLSSTKQQLEERVALRVEDMLKNGLEQEVRLLVDQYGWGCEGLKGIGYAQWRGYFEGNQSQAETKAKIIKVTLDLAKRQRTWFKRNKSIHWAESPNEAVDIVTTFLNKNQR